MPAKSEINLIRSLSDRRARQQAGLFVAEGEKLLSELSASGLRVRKVFHTGGFYLPGVECEAVSAREMERLSRLKTPSSAVALVELPRHALDAAAIGRSLTLALDGIQDPGNLGTVIRIADWFGIKDIICSEECADCFNPKAVQASMGAIIRVRVHYAALADVLAPLSVPVYGTFLEGEDIYGAALSPHGVIVMGSEGRGISPGVEGFVTRKLFIPPYPAGSATSESLNVAAAAAIVCSEFRRR